MITEMRTYLQTVFPSMTFLGHEAQDGYEAFVVVRGEPMGSYEKQINGQTRIPDDINILIYNQSNTAGEAQFQQLREFFAVTEASYLTVGSYNIINVNIETSGFVGFDDNSKIIYQITLNIEREI